MTPNPHQRRALGLVAMLVLLLAVGACVRLRESASSDPAAAGNISKAQVVTTTSPESTGLAATAVATEPTTDATPTPTASAVATMAVETPVATAVATSTPPGPTPTMMACKMSALDDELDVEFEERDDDGGAPRNGIKLCSRKDDRLRVKGRVQLNRISANTVQPRNEALAWARCTDCSTISVALQMNLVPKGATTISPVNKAIAYNYQCTRCRTFAVAYQYVHQVDNPREVPENVRRLVNEMNREIREISSSDRRITIEEAAQRLDAVISQFYELNQGLQTEKNETTEPTSPGADRTDDGDG
jgi:hypothetical protein